MSDLLPFQRACFQVRQNTLETLKMNQIYDSLDFVDYKNDGGDFRWEAFGLYIVLKRARARYNFQIEF